MGRRVQAGSWSLVSERAENTHPRTASLDGFDEREGSEGRAAGSARESVYLPCVRPTCSSASWFAALAERALICIDSVWVFTFLRSLSSLSRRFEGISSWVH